MAVQFFKNDSTELKMYNSAVGVLTTASEDKDDFWAGAYDCALLGDVIYENNLSPLSNAIPQDIFRSSFNEIFQAFVHAGTFESYLSVFRKIFGDDVDVEFTVPGPGKLTISIESMNVELSTFVAREIVDNAYVFYPMITQDGVDTLVFQTIKGFQSQYDLEQMLFELVPDGVYTEITLSFGS